MTSQDMLNWTVIGMIICDEPWGTGCIGPKTIGKPGSGAIRRWGIEPPICAKYVRVRVLQTFNDSGPELHYIRFSKSSLTLRLDFVRDISDVGMYPYM